MINDHDLNKAICPNCVSEMRIDVVHEHQTSWVDDEHPIDGRDRYWILRCRGCEHVFFGHGNSFSENVDYKYGKSTGEPYPFVVEEKTFYPRTIKRGKPAWFNWRFKIGNTHVSNLLTELYQALDNELAVLSAMAARLVFDAVSKELGVDSSLPFKDKIEELRKEQHITGRERDYLELLVDAGGAAAHRGWSPSSAELETIMEVLESFIHRALVLPAKVDTMKTKVPSKDV